MPESEAKTLFLIDRQRATDLSPFFEKMCEQLNIYYDCYYHMYKEFRDYSRQIVFLIKNLDPKSELYRRLSKDDNLRKMVKVIDNYTREDLRQFTAIRRHNQQAIDFCLALARYLNQDWSDIEKEMTELEINNADLLNKNRKKTVRRKKKT
ncbi:hypothetical protein C4J81_18940 (plasmid) [Deltaproteobacteria bacterium Smac51]|nr:hypothetical protein C4J81_18940 [Deltaproteobacteria bacterium Smac51]